ncbi:MAG: hypothetical protein BGO55_08405 [Sphingobacteriales bacterium 50-39]|nr:hypothetical protein [Sphingobacteriales bacterium]OJW59284.1 MAG: hypothetical protein BGO55_08405 [Sphingobacteriales bacterium 50-39]
MMKSEHTKHEEDYTGYLLSEQKRTDLHYHNWRCRETIERLTGEWELIGKYHERLWFQRAFRMSQDELLERYRELAYHLTWAEKDIETNNWALYMHGVAVEQLHKDMTPFDKLDMTQHRLVQKNLFD